MDTNEDRPTIPSNTALAALAADVGGMLETGIGVIANLGHQIEALFPMLPGGDAEGDPQLAPRLPMADTDGCSMAMHLRQFYMRALMARVARELCGDDPNDWPTEAAGPRGARPQPQGMFG